MGSAASLEHWGAGSIPRSGQWVKVPMLPTAAAWLRSLTRVISICPGAAKKKKKKPYEVKFYQPHFTDDKTDTHKA